MKVWLIWVQEPDCGGTWLEAAWEDEMTAENYEGYMEDVGRVKKLCFDNGYEMRIQAVQVPGVNELFVIPEVAAITTLPPQPEDHR